VNAALDTIPTGTIKETNKLMYTTAAVILQMLGYKMNNTRRSKGQYLPHGDKGWRPRSQH